MITLSDIQSRIERSFYEVTRLRCVAEGYTPDIYTYADTPAGFTQYKTDLATIYDTKGFAVELFGVSNPQDKGYKKLPRIVFTTDVFMPGEYGLDTTEYLTYLPGTDEFLAQRPSSSMTYQMFLSCYIVADTTEEMRTLVAIINATIPLRGMIKYADSDDTFFTELTDFNSLDSAADGLIEKAYRFRVPDIIWTDDITGDTWSPIKSIELNIYIAEHLGLGIIVPAPD